MSYAKITILNNRNGLSLMTHYGQYGLFLKIVQRFLIAASVFCIMFLAINTDRESLKYYVKSKFGQSSAYNMDISKDWIEKYNIVITNKIDVNDDSDADGLTFKQEATYRTNPFQKDTDGDGTSDGIEVKSGSNPLGNGELDNDMDGMPDNWEKQLGLSVDTNDDNQDLDNDGLVNIQEYLHGTDPKNPDTDGDGYSDAEELINGYDPDAPGSTQPNVVILADKIGLVAPIIWSKSEDQLLMLKDLEKGVIHYPASGVPGQKGNMIVAGHSSNYVWAKGDYNSVFRNLNKLGTGDLVIIRLIQKNGRTFDYRYEIAEKRILNPADEWIFANSESTSMLTLSTCWPIGTDLSRLVIRANRQSI